MERGKLQSFMEHFEHRVLTDLLRPAYNFTGSTPIRYNAGVAPSQEYDITPTAVFGVA
jgi:hypothetical protein